MNLRSSLIMFIGLLMAAAPTVQALEPIALLASPTEDGSIQVQWTDPGTADEYILERTDLNGAMTQFTISGDQFSFLDTDLAPGTYTYRLTAERTDGNDQSNPAAALNWPGCLPGVVTGPPWIYWPHQCACPFPGPLHEVDYLICD